MVIRLAEPEQWGAVISAAAEIFENEQQIPRALNPIPAELSPRWWCAEEDGVILGTLAAYFTDGQCHVGRLTVSPACRGRGLGGKLLQHALEELFSQGVPEVYADARDQAVRLLCRLGGQVTGPGVPFYVGNVTPVLVKKEDFTPVF